MSNPAFRRGRGGFSPRGRGGFSPRGRGAGSLRPRVEIDSYSESDDLPELETKQSTESIHIMEDYYSEEETYSESYDSNEHDWKSHQKPTNDNDKPKPHRPAPPPSDPNKVRRNIPQKGRRPLQKRPIPIQKPQDPPPPKETQNNINSKAEESSEYSYSDENLSPRVQNSNEVTETNQDLITDTQKNQLANEIQNSIERDIKSPNQQQEEPNQQQSQLNQQQTQPNQQQKEPNQQQAQSNLPELQAHQLPMSPSSDLIQVNEQSFQISYERAINLWKRPVQMTQNDILVYRCQSIHDKKYGKVHIVCSKNPVSQSSQYYSGMIVRHQNGSRFTILDKSGGMETPSQLAGISFIDLPGDDSRIRYFRVAIPDAGYQYVPSTKDEDLSRIANIGHPKPNIKIWSSALPKKHGNGRLTLDMGPYQVKRSLKNFIIRDENDNIMFLIFKSFDGVCKIKASPPFTPFIAFGLGVAILTSMK